MTVIILPISRTEFIDDVFSNLRALVKPKDTELIIITDGDEKLAKAVDVRLDSLSFNKINVMEYGKAPALDRDTRRFRISDIHNKLKHFIPEYADYIFSIEDDTIYPPFALEQMLDTMQRFEDCAFVEGIQVGRHKTRYIGAWTTDNPNAPQRIESIMPGEGIQEIDAGGLYCALIDAELYKMHHFEPLDVRGTNGLSCDVNFGLYLRQQGYKVLADHDIQCGHLIENGIIYTGSTDVVQVEFLRDYKNKWTSTAR